MFLNPILSHGYLVEGGQRGKSGERGPGMELWVKSTTVKPPAEKTEQGQERPGEASKVSTSWLARCMGHS